MSGKYTVCEVAHVTAMVLDRPTQRGHFRCGMQRNQEFLKE